MDVLAPGYGVTLAVCGLFALVAFTACKGAPDPFPTVGVGSSPLAAWVATLRSFTHFHTWVREGYDKVGTSSACGSEQPDPVFCTQHKSGIFRVRLLGGWNYVVSGDKLIDELRRAPDNVFSLSEASAVILQSDYTLGDWRTAASVDLAIFQTKLNRKLEQIVPVAVEEIRLAFEEEITSLLDGDEWTTVTVGESVMRIVGRVSNRLFVGLPLCRNLEYVNLGVQYAIDVFMSANLLRHVPAFLKPIVGRFVLPIRRTHARAERLLSGCITERLLRSAEGAEDVPDDFLQWVIDAGEPRMLNARALTQHMLRLNLAAIHSTAVTFTFALYQLAAHGATYQAPLRREVEAAVATHGWTKAGLEDLHMLDSFLRETQRFHSVAAVSLDRKAMRDYTFANGMTVKKGDIVSPAIRATHHDPAIYADADTFDGFRFCAPDGADPAPANRMTSPSLHFLTFGSGRHACPGRFWAANELKAMMAYMVTHYDMRMEQDGVVPAEKWVGAAVIPDRNARMRIRRRPLSPE